MMHPDDVSPRARNHYREDEYFSLNVRSGVVRNPLGTRVVGIPEELIAGLHAGLTEETGGAADIVLYNCGKWWGKQFSVRHNQEMRQFFGKDQGELPMHFYLQVLKRVWALHGWGSVALSFALQEQGFIEVAVEQAMYSSVVGSLSRHSDAVTAGFLASVVSDMAGRDLECVEVACKSKGDTRCEFIIGLKSRIDVAQSWVKQGRSRAEILEAIRSGSLV
jgi:predicted hydrocarbon binding protein